MRGSLQSAAGANGWLSVFLWLAAVPAAAQRNPVAPTVQPTSTLVIPATSSTGEVEFADAVDATRLPNGQVVVADLGDRELVVFDSSGHRIQTIGRAGQGPGEFRYPGWIQQCRGDSLFVWDAVQQRMAVFDAGGRFIRQFRFPNALSTLTCARAGAFGYTTPQGRLGRPGADSPVYKATLTIASPTGDSMGSLGLVPIGQNRPLAAISQVALCEGKVWFAPPDVPEVRLFDFHGKSLGTITIDEPRRHVTNVHYERAIANLAGRITNAAERPAVEQFYRRIPPPDFLPLVNKILCDPRGGAWIQLSAPGDGLTRFLIVGSRSGRRIQVTIPDEVDVTEIDRGTLVSIRTDSDGQQSVVVYRYTY